MPFPRLRFRHTSPVPWDLAIGMLLAGSGATALLAGASVWAGTGGITGVMLGILCVFGTLAFVTVLYGSFIEPQWIAVRRMTLPFPAKLRIAVVSDFHVGPYKGEAFVRRAVRTINALAPDLVLMPGDYLYDDQADPKALAPLKELTSRLGVFGVFGNHDEGRLKFYVSREPLLQENRCDELRTLLTRLRVRLLEDAHAIVENNGTPIAVAGTIDPWERDVRLKHIFDAIPSDMPVILLTHTPDVTLSPDATRARLIFTGHTHGGQIRLPVIGNLARIPMRADQRFTRGIFRLADHSTLVVSSGIGESGPRARLLCRPEILLVETEPE